MTCNLQLAIDHVKKQINVKAHRTVHGWKMSPKDSIEHSAEVKVANRDTVPD